MQILDLGKKKKGFIQGINLITSFLVESILKETLSALSAESGYTFIP